MRPVTLGAPRGASDKEKLDWCVRSLQEISRATREADPNVAADGFDTSNVTETRSFDADTVTLAVLADVVGTFIEDLKRRGQKRTS